VPQPEAAFKAKLIAAYRVAFPQGWYQFNAAHHRRGVPDLQFLLPGGRVVWIEAKVSPYKASKIQLAVHQAIARAGGAVLLAAYSPAVKRLELLRATGHGPAAYDHPWANPSCPISVLEAPDNWHRLIAPHP
jgi:hypothetical protein